MHVIKPLRRDGRSSAQSFARPGCKVFLMKTAVHLWVACRWPGEGRWCVGTASRFIPTWHTSTNIPHPSPPRPTQPSRRSPVFLVYEICMNCASKRADGYGLATRGAEGKGQLLWLERSLKFWLPIRMETIVALVTKISVLPASTEHEIQSSSFVIRVKKKSNSKPR